ncbi:MAG: tyrosine-protein phosphatase [Eubacteriales bacterium]
MYMLDLHCHLLPGLDDGAFQEEETLQMAAMAAAGCTRGIVCTPHAPASAYSLRELLGTFQRVRTLLAENRIPVQLYLGQEIFVDHDYRNLPEKFARRELLTINQSIYPLVEFHPRETEESVCRKLAFLASGGCVPIVAHPERYAFLQQDDSAANRLRQTGALLQVNKDSLQGGFGPAAAHAANVLLRGRMADFVASDAHGPYARTTPLREIHERISEEYSLEYADMLLRVNPIRVLKNEKIYPY